MRRFAALSAFLDVSSLNLAGPKAPPFFLTQGSRIQRRLCSVTVMNVMLRPGSGLEGSTQTAWFREIERKLGNRAFQAGLRYSRQGRVSAILYAPDGGSLTARTRGSVSRPYGQRITLTRRPDGGLDFTGQCSCPVRYNCKHTAAVLITADFERLGQADPNAPSRLPEHYSRWLKQLELVAEPESEEYPASVADRLFYMMNEDAGRPGVLRIEPRSVRLNKDGSFGEERSFDADRVLHSSVPKYLRPSDQWVLRRLSSKSQRDWPAEQGEVLSRILATGRARWRGIGGLMLREGPTRRGRLAWRMQGDATQRPVVEGDAGLIVLRGPAPWYVDTEAGEMGPVDCGLPSRLAVHLLAAPALRTDEAVLISAELRRRMPALEFPVPVEPPEAEVLVGPVVPVLRLFAAAPERNIWSGTVDDSPIAAARLAFRYGPLELTETKYSLMNWLNGRLYRVQRDEAGERRATATLEKAGLMRVARFAPWRTRDRDAFGYPDVADGSEAAWLGFLIATIPELRANGWVIETAADFPIRVVAAEGDFRAELIEATGIDWFELSLGVIVEGERIDLAPILAAFIASPAIESLMGHAEVASDDLPLPLPLPDGRFLTVPAGRIRPILTALIELHAGGLTDGSGRVGFGRLDAASFAELEAAIPEVVWHGGEALRALGAKLRAAGGALPQAKLPPEFAGALRPYQQHGVDWLQFLREVELGGVLADDMGLGKTVQTLAHVAIEKAQGRLGHPVLIVCPTSLVPNWLSEAARFTPELKVLALHGARRQRLFDSVGAHDLVISTYPLLTRDAPVLTGQEWHLVVLDEAQTIKNPEAVTTKLAAGLKARQRLCLSGTPLQNHLGELWSLFDFLAPGFLGQRKAFRARYQNPIEKHGDGARRTTLVRRVRPFLLRRTKEEVAADLPPKTEIVEHVEMEAGQRAIYEGVRLAMHKKVREAIAARGLARSGIVVLDALLKMRQACCDPRLLKLSAAKIGKAGSAKLERLMEMLPTLREDGRRILLFSQFTSMLDLIKPRLEEARMPYVELRGETADRATPVERFQKGKVELFLISLKAGGTGLNLTAADTVIHYDPWWNPAVEDQATDRAHRIGQERPVFVHRLVTVGTIEEKMEELKRRKRALVDGILNAEHGGVLGLAEADVDALFA
jgi:superfamily II DNA or RNA helicase